jgi:hypothetical protein
VCRGCVLLRKTSASVWLAGWARALPVGVYLGETPEECVCLSVCLYVCLSGWLG